MSKSKEASVSKQILDYMMDQNRPFSANDILGSIQAECGKTAVIRTIDMLVSEKKIKEKIYGKQKIYYINQNMFASLQNVDVQTMDAEINELSNTWSALQKEIKSSEDALGNLNKSITNEAAESELEHLKVEIPALKEKLKNLQNKSGNFDPKEKKALCDKQEKYHKEYIRRKRMANNIIDAILEGYPKSKKQLLEELGVETDGDMKI